MRVPFTLFQAAILNRMNVAPSQLHPNGWACIQAFIVMCSDLGIMPSVSVFFHYYYVWPLAKCGWVSLTSVQDCCFFKPYSESFKDFKTKYFKIIMKEGGCSQFRDAADKPLFPYYWTENPARINPMLTDSMTPAEVEAVKTINDLPRRLHARQLVDCLHHEDFINVVFSMILVFVHVFSLQVLCRSRPPARQATSAFS